MLTQVIVTFRSALVCSRISCHQSTLTMCTHEIIDCGNVFALGQSERERLHGKILTLLGYSRYTLP